MHFNNVGYILVVQTEQEIQRHSRGGDRSILLCIYNELMKTETFAPTQLLWTSQVIYSIQIICSPAKTSLTKRQGFSGSCEEKYSGALWLCWGFNILALWRMQCWDFPRGLSGPGELSRDFFVQKARIYELLQRWPHKNERPLSQYRHSEHTEMIYIYTEATQNVYVAFLTVCEIHIH